jgi:ribosomal protein L21E
MATKPKTKSAKQAKVGKVMHEFKTGTLHSGKGGPVVKSQKQAVAIAMSEAGMSKKTKKK